MKTLWTIDELRDALQAYDEEHGQFPEHPFEGEAVWLWLREWPGRSPTVLDEYDTAVRAYWDREVPPE